MRHTPQLHVITATLQLPEPKDERWPVVGTVHGQSEYRRSSLWHESSVWHEPEDRDLAPADWVHHIMLVALQDRPNTQERLIFGLTGGLGVQDPLW